MKNKPSGIASMLLNDFNKKNKNIVLNKDQKTIVEILNNYINDDGSQIQSPNQDSIDNKPQLDQDTNSSGKEGSTEEGKWGMKKRGLAVGAVCTLLVLSIYVFRKKIKNFINTISNRIGLRLKEKRLLEEEEEVLEENRLVGDLGIKDSIGG